MQGTQRFVISFLLVSGVIVWQTLSRLFRGIALTADLPDPAILGNNLPFTSVLGLGLAIGGGFYVFRHKTANAFLNDVVTELQKVAWPDRKETQNSTIVVIVTTLVISLILGVFDLVWGKLTGFIYLPPQ